MDDESPAPEHPERHGNTKARQRVHVDIPTHEELGQAGRREDLVVREWRAQQLHRLGLSWLLAQTFAAVVDWHELARLVERGCSPELALEIVR
jgi:hypothetical protein